MRCGFLKRAIWLLALVVPAVFAAKYSVTLTYEGDGLYYAIYNRDNGTWYTDREADCFQATDVFSFNLNSKDLDKYELNFYTDETCYTRLSDGAIPLKDLFPTSQQAKITVNEDGSWQFTNGQKPAEDPEEPKDPEGPVGPGQDDPRDPDEPGNDNPAKGGMKIVAFFTPWTNTNAKMFLDGESVAMIPVAEKYCGWFIAAVDAPAEGFNVYFKQTIGPNYVGSEGLTTTEPTTATEISLDSVAALSDTVWVRGSQEGAPIVYSKHPNGVLGDCPVKKLPVMMFDWLHGGKGDGVRGNGNPEYGVSADFGSGGCSGSPMRGMVEKELGANGVPVPADPFPGFSECTYRFSCRRCRC